MPHLTAAALTVLFAAATAFVVRSLVDSAQSWLAHYRSVRRELTRIRHS